MDMEIKRAGCFDGDNPKNVDDICKKSDCPIARDCMWKLRREEMRSDYISNDSDKIVNE